MSRLPGQPVVSTFVIRIWQDWSLSGLRWYGRIEHLQSGRAVAFQELDHVLAFMMASGVFSSAPPGDNDDQSGG